MSPVEIKQLIIDIVEGHGTDTQIAAKIELLKKNVPHPAVTDLIFHNSVELNVDEIFERATTYRPIRL